MLNRLNPLKRSPLHSSVFALGLTAIALLVTLAIRSYLEPNTFLLFIAAAWVSAWLYGRTGGLTATAASALAILYFFYWPEVSASPPSWRVLSRLLAFVAMASLITWVTASSRDSRRLLASTLSSIADAVAAADRDGRITFLNPIAETLTGWRRQEAKGRPAAEILRLIDAKNREPVENPLLRALRDRVTVGMTYETVLVSRSGSETPVEQTAAPVRDDADEIRGAILVFRDISKRLQLEEQATHAQKMEAVERLAGGVAGDFNNVLTVITGYAELLRTDVPETSPMRRFLDEIIYAGERAAALTRHLLAFSRGSTSQPRVVDLNATITGLEPALRRMLGHDIELILLTAPDLGRVKADPAQLEQAILNLATNAREAMPKGGKLVIETADVDLEEGSSKQVGVKPGSYVMLAVSDTGVGMDPDTRLRLFEPFFTTKAPGKGSGLGLATVYGVTKQSDGQVTVYSQPGCGTIFEIYLPRVAEAVAEPAKRIPAKGSETILLVDDEEGVRRLIAAVLQSNGYDVLEASNGVTALAAYEKNAHKVDIVLTDIVMPQMSGLELGIQLTSRSAGLKILYMSGYRDSATNTATGEVRPFLLKPFTPDVLLSKVREVLDTA